LAQRSPHRKQQQHDREQQQKDQEWRRFLLSDDNDYDREDIIISIDDVSAMSSPSSSSSTLGEGTRNNNNNQENPTTPVMKKQNQQEEKRNKVVSFRLSEREYERHLAMAKLCHENGLTKGPDIVSYIRLSMECLWQYINNNSQARVEPSAEKREKENRQQQPQNKQEGGVEQQQDVVDYHPMTASPSRAAAAPTNTAMGEEQHSRDSIARTPSPTPSLFNLHEYFQPVFDELDKMNKMLDSHIEEENDKSKEKKK
jgi:hypothetical protein